MPKRPTRCSFDEQPELYVYTKVSVVHGIYHVVDQSESASIAFLFCPKLILFPICGITQVLVETYILSQNRAQDAPHFLTCAIQPSGIFGIGDLVVLPGILEAYYRGQTKVANWMSQQEMPDYQKSAEKETMRCHRL